MIFLVMRPLEVIELKLCWNSASSFFFFLLFLLPFFVTVFFLKEMTSCSVMKEFSEEVENVVMMGALLSDLFFAEQTFDRLTPFLDSLEFSSLCFFDL